MCIRDRQCSECVCHAGLSDEVRADFNVMRDLAVHTRIGPADRVKRLQKFIDDINKYLRCYICFNIDFCTSIEKGTSLTSLSRVLLVRSHKILECS